MPKYEVVRGRALPTLNPDQVRTDSAPSVQQQDDRIITQGGSSTLPVVNSLSSGSTASGDSESLIKRVITGGAVVVSSAIAATIIIGLLSGVVQDYARRRRYRAGGGAFWGWLATIPSLRHPCPPFALVEHRQNGANSGTIKANVLYKDICLLPTLTSGNGVVLLDDWGGWTRFDLDTGANKYTVTWIDTETDNIGAVSYDGRYTVFSKPSFEDSLKHLYLAEKM